MRRERMLRRLDEQELWDVLVIGGGATGLGIAIDAAARGYATLLLERGDFAQGTSSRSTKLAHGGVRYLQQGNVSLVVEALHERGLMRRNAPHLVHDLEFVVPNYDWWEAPFYGVGLKVYDLLAGKHGFGASRLLTREQTIERIPTIETDGLRGGVLYFDGQFDDARLAINLARTAAEQGATLLNYFEVDGIRESDGLVEGVTGRDIESDDEHELAARVVINATGVFSDTIRRLDDPAARPMIQASQGIHIVLPSEFLPGDSAVMVPHTDDGRVLFAIPWHDVVVVGTTDTPMSEIEAEPRPLSVELDFLLRHCARYLTRDPEPADVLSAFAGLRPLVADPDSDSTAQISRDHTIVISRSGLMTVAGGKWTTYRRMAEDAVDQAALLAGLPEQPCVTRELNIHGYLRHAERHGALAVYGADASEIERLIEEAPELGAPLHPSFSHRAVEVVWAARHEMARQLEDVMARRTRMLLLDARASIECAPRVAELLADELGHDTRWAADQSSMYERLATRYLVG